MIDVNVEPMVPAFLRADKNGAALAKAIEAGLQIFAETLQNGINTILNPDDMPEWRLDEMAQEYNLPYDYAGDIEMKRRIVKTRFQQAALAGTSSAIIYYISQMNPDWNAVVTERPITSAMLPKQFDVTVNWTEENPEPYFDHMEYAIREYLAPVRSSLRVLSSPIQ